MGYIGWKMKAEKVLSGTGKILGRSAPTLSTVTAL